MDKKSFGEILRETRERKGLDLNATARRLRIRPDILQAIEEADFAAMPPRGYARNMVNGYARYLGLNPTEITGMYLDELYAYQVEYETSRMRPTGIAMPSSQSAARSQRRETATRGGNRRTYSIYDDDEYSDDYRTPASRRTASTTRGSSRSRGERLYPESRTHQARGTVLPTNTYTNFYSGPGPIGFLQANWRYLVAALVALIIIGLIISQILSCTRKEETTETTAVPVTGVASSENAVIAQPKAPTNFTFEYTVASGDVSWIEVYVDDQIQVGEAVQGPQTRSFTSSDTIRFITANPAPVTAKLDGEVIQLEPDPDGVVNMEWKFSDILAQWLSDHPGVKAADSTATTTDASTTEGDTATTDGATTDANATADAQTTEDTVAVTTEEGTNAAA